MDIKNLTTFLRVADLGGFTRAASELGYSQSTVSFQIKQLEEELGTPLFERVRHTVTLTERGREALMYAQQITKLEKEMKMSASSDMPAEGLVRLTAPSSLAPILLGSAYPEFRRRYPGIALKIIEADTQEMFRLINHNEADIMLTLDNHIYSSEYILSYESQIGVHFIAQAGHPLADAGSVTLEELLREPFMLTERGMSYRRLLDEQLAARSLEITPVLESGNAYQLCALVAQGTGLSFLPDHVTADAVRDGSVVELNVPDIDITIWKQLLCHRSKLISPAMQAVMDYCMSM